MDVTQAVLAWLAGAGGAYLAVEVRIRWLRADYNRLARRLERVEERVITGSHVHGSSAST